MIKYIIILAAGLLLLVLNTLISRKHYVPGTTAAANGKNEIKHRIKMIAYFKKPAAVWIFVTLIIIASIAAVCLTNATGNKQQAYAPPKGTIKSIGDAEKKEISDYWENTFKGADNNSFRGTYNGYLPQEGEEQMLKKYGISLYNIGLESSHRHAQWLCSYRLIEYFNSSDVKNVIPSLEKLNAGTQYDEVKSATGFALDILEHKYQDTHIQTDSSGKKHMFTDFFECSLGGSNNVWFIKNNTLYLLHKFELTNYKDIGIQQLSMSKDGKHLAVNLQGRKCTWGYIVDVDKFKVEPYEIIDKMNPSLKKQGYNLYHESGQNTVYYSYIKDMNWMDNDRLILTVDLSLSTTGSDSPSDSFKGDILYNVEKGTFMITSIETPETTKTTGTNSSASTNGQ